MFSRVSKAAGTLTASLIIGVFVYTALSKLYALELFRFVLTRSPLVAPLAGVLAWAVPLLEIAVSLLLVMPALRWWGYFGSTLLLAAFTIHTAALLVVSQDLSCGCGGFFNALSGPVHLVINSLLLALSSWQMRQHNSPFPALSDAALKL